MNKIKEIDNLNNLILIKKQTIDEMNLKIEQLEKEIKQLKTNMGIYNDNNYENIFDGDKINKDATLFNGIDEIIQEIHDNNNENNNNIDIIEEVGIDDNKKCIEEEGKGTGNKETFSEFVFSLNNNLNGTKEKNNNTINDKDFGIESLTKRKPFGDFNFE